MKQHSQFLKYQRCNALLIFLVLVLCIYLLLTRKLDFNLSKIILNSIIRIIYHTIVLHYVIIVSLMTIIDCRQIMRLNFSHAISHESKQNRILIKSRDRSNYSKVLKSLEITKYYRRFFSFKNPVITCLMKEHTLLSNNNVVRRHYI